MFGSTPGDVTGQTIAIIGWGDNTGLANSDDSSFDSSDLHAFDVAYDLPDPPSFKKIDEYGGTDLPDPATQFDDETDLDVEWAHAMAPGANIILVETAPDDFPIISMDTARNYPGVSVVSMSIAAVDTDGHSGPAC